tara:strand:+ start:78 stop:602 length:525 start_codon:yes stop_codon:yes gene_type:complete
MKLNKVVWFTGMSGAGKTTLSKFFSKELLEKGYHVKMIDGDVIRNKKNNKLDFSSNSIKLNNRNIIETCEKNLKKFDFILVAVIMPFQQIRQEARKRLGKSYFEVFVDADFDTLTKRDTKGLYKKALSGEIKNFIGVDQNTPFERPLKPDLTINTLNTDPQESCNILIKSILKR